MVYCNELHVSPSLFYGRQGPEQLRFTACGTGDFGHLFSMVGNAPLQQVSKTDAGSHAAAPDQPGVPPRPAPAQATVAARPRPRYVVTIHEYQGQESNDLRFGAGQLIEVMQEKQSGWWRGRIGQRSGVFPVNFTRPARDDELPDASAS